MRPLPRINGPIFDTGHNMTPENFPAAWDLTMEELESANGGGTGAASSSGFDLALWGCGRIAGTDYFTTDSAQITLPDSPSLSLKLPAAVYYVADAEGAMHRFSASVRTLSDIPALLDNQRGYLRAYEVEDSGGEWALEAFGWGSALDAAKVAAGYPCLGVVSSDTDSVTGVSNDKATVIFPQPLIQALLRTLLGSGGGGGDGGGGTGIAAATQLPISLTDETDTKDYIDNIAGDLDAKIAKLGGNADPFPAPFDVLADEIALNRSGLAEVNPPSIERGQISVVVANAGKGQFDTPDFAPDSPTTGDPLELSWDAAEGLFGP